MPLFSEGIALFIVHPPDLSPTIGDRAARHHGEACLFFAKNWFAAP